MDKQAKDALHLTERSPEELHAVLRNFELKWHKKASAATGRISRY